MEKKRKNYSEKEKQMLLSLVEQHKDIIENKCTKAVSVAKKDEAWKDIRDTFNSSAESGTRDIKQLKVLYENMKREIRKNVAVGHQKVYIEKIRAAKAAAADCKREILKTGGGKADVMITSDQEKLLAELQGQVQPLSNPFDQAAEYFCEDALTGSGSFDPEPEQVPDFDSELGPEPTPEPVPEPLIESQPEPMPEPPKNRKRQKIIIKKPSYTAEVYRKLYFKQKYINALNDGKAQKIIQTLTISKLKLEIKKLKQ